MTASSPNASAHASVLDLRELTVRRLLVLNAPLDLGWCKFEAGTKCVVLAVQHVPLGTLVDVKVLAGTAPVAHVRLEHLSHPEVARTLTEQELRDHPCEMLTLAQRSALLEQMMAKMPESWRYHWCSGGLCACLGGANCSGALQQAGLTKGEWQTWVENNPKPAPTQKVTTLTFFRPAARHEGAAPVRRKGEVYTLMESPIEYSYSVDPTGKA